MKQAKEKHRGFLLRFSLACSHHLYHLLPEQDEAVIDNFAVVVMSEQPVMKSGSLFDFFQEVGQVVVNIAAISQYVHDAVWGAVCDHIVHLIVNAFQAVPSFLILGFIGKLLFPPGSVVDPESGAHSAKGPVLFFVIGCFGVQDTVLDIMASGTAHGKEGVWEGVSFHAPRGQITAITGQNGAGKTTLARCLCGLMKEQSGTIFWDGKPLSRTERRRKAFLIMQDVNLQLFGDSVLAEIRLGNTATEQEALTTLGRMDLAQYADTHPMALSGGQKQRLAVADGCLSGKELLIFDEPTSGLDYGHMLEVSRRLRELAEQGLCVVVITHDGEFLRESGAWTADWLPNDKQR